MTHNTGIYGGESMKGNAIALLQQKYKGQILGG